MRMKTALLVALILCSAPSSGSADAGDITPEQVFQQAIDWNSVMGTWEVLPQDSPLTEKEKTPLKLSHRTLMTLRKDGTCRIFNKQHPLGADGLWTFDDHEVFITFGSGVRMEFYVYGVKGDFMVTQSRGDGGKDQLWSRVK
jgi:hypothetical protein